MQPAKVQTSDGISFKEAPKIDQLSVKKSSGTGSVPNEVQHGLLVTSSDGAVVEQDVKVLTDLCSKCCWEPPEFVVCPTEGEGYLFKVRVNGHEFKPSECHQNENGAKAEAARICLASFGMATP